MTAVKVGTKNWLDQLAVARTGDGRMLGSGLLAEIRREADRLALVEGQIKEVGVAQRVALKDDTVLSARACKLKCLKGFGNAFASGLVHEAFRRNLENRRYVGGAFGLTRWPWDSGETRAPTGRSAKSATGGHGQWRSNAPGCGRCINATAR